MDPATIATGVVTVLAPFVKKAAEEFAGEAGKAVLEKAKALLAKVKTKLSGDPFMAGTVERFEMEPEEYRDFFEKELRKQLEQDVAFAHELGALRAILSGLDPRLRLFRE